MNKFLKIFLISLASILCFLYVAFLIAPPIFNICYNLDKHKNDIQSLLKQTTKLNFDYSKIKIYTTPLLSAGVVIEDIDVKLDDNTSIFEADKIKGGVALPSLLTLTVKTAKTEVVNPKINLEIVNNEQYKILTVVEDIINENNAKPKKEQTKQDEYINKIVKLIRIKVPSVNIVNYNVLVNDLKTNHNLKLSGEKLTLGYNSAKNIVKVKTNAKLLSDDKENVTALIDISSSLPEIQQNTEAKDPEEKIALPFVNPVTIYQTYDLNADIASKLRIRNTKQGFISFGYFNIDNINLKLSDIRLPNSYIHAKTQGKRIGLDCNLYAKDDEKIAILTKLKYGKNPRIKTQLLSDKIHFSNLKDLLAGLLDSLNIKNDLSQIQATGYLSADTTFATNFKKLKSQGSILIKDGSFVNPKNNIGIKDIIANIILDNNVLNIENTSLLINNSKLTANGSIDTKSNTDINLNIDNLSLAELYGAFAPKELKKAFSLNNAYLTTNANIKGKLDNLDADLNVKLNNLNLSDAKKTMFITNDNLNVDFKLNPKVLDGKIANTNFKFNMPQIKTTGKIDSLNISLDNENLTINPFNFVYNNASKINIKGEIANYLKNPNIDIFIDGNVLTSDINQTLGKQIAMFIPSKGAIPVKVAINGDSKEQEIKAQIFANANNYFTPINLNSLIGAQSIAQAQVKINGNKIKIKNSGLFKAQNGFSNDLDSNMLNASQIVDLTAILDNGHINLFRINIPQNQSGSIALFKKSSFNTKGKIVLTGEPDDLDFGGDLKLWNVKIPELYLGANEIDLDFITNGLNLRTKEINVNGSKIDASLKANLKPVNNNFKISDINVKSNLIDVDKAMVVANEAMKYVVPATPTNAKSSSSANIPVVADGKLDIKKLTTGAIVIENIKSNLDVRNNDLILSNLNCDAFKGKIKGNIKMNLISGLMAIKLNGKNLDANKALVDAANMKDTISGDLDFKTDITLKGATYEEQMKSLKGSIDFELTDGQYGPFAKLENFFLAENIRENAFFKNTIGVILNPITTIDSTHFEKLTGRVTFNNGVVDLGSIKSQGDILCVLVQGDMNLLTNELDSKVKVRLASAVSDMLGPIAMANPVNLVKNTPGLNVATSKLFTVFSQVVTQEEYKEIPDFSKNHSDANATKFQIVLDGDVAKPLTLVKSFKWLTLKEDMEKAKTFSENYAKEELLKQLQDEYEQNHKLKVGLEKVLQIDTTAPEVKEIIKQEAQKAKEQTTQSVQNAVEVKKESVKQEVTAKTQELEKKVQNKVETTVQKQEQKLLDVESQLKSKLQEKLKIPTQNQTTNEEIKAE